MYVVFSVQWGSSVLHSYNILHRNKHISCPILSRPISAESLLSHYSRNGSLLSLSQSETSLITPSVTFMYRSSPQIWHTRMATITSQQWILTVDSVDVQSSSMDTNGGQRRHTEEQRYGY